MNLKKVLKTIKLHEREISIAAGVLVIFLAGVFVIRYVRQLQQASQSQQVTSPEVNVQTHTVVKGETLWSIAQKYYQKGGSWKQIADANKITDPAKLEVGQVLVIPPVPTATPAAATATAVNQTLTPAPTGQILDQAAATTSAITGNSYTVVKGDCLWTIAVRAYGDGFKWVDIAKANNLHNPNLIHRGNVFVIPR